MEAALGGLTTGDRLLMIGVATGCLILDGVDGWVARARSEVSAFGARFDMETDAVLLLCLSVAVPILGVAGWWVLALSGMRYGYLAAVAGVVPGPADPAAGDYARKVVAVIAARGADRGSGRGSGLARLAGRRRPAVSAWPASSGPSPGTSSGRSASLDPAHRSRSRT